MTLLELVQGVCMELGISSPAAVVTSTDPQILQILAIANRFGHDLSRVHPWQRLDKEYILTTASTTTTGTTALNSAIITGIPSTTGLTTNYGISGDNIAPFAQIVSVDSSTQVTMNLLATGAGTASTLVFGQVQYPLPSDWLKQIPQTEWDRSNRWPLLGPQSPQDWQSFKSGIVYAGPRMRFRIQGQTLSINPPPAANLNLAFEYISSSWVTNGATYKTKFSSDTDTTIFDDSLMISGVKFKWLQAKGFDYSYAQKDYLDYLSNCMGQDSSAPVLSLAPKSGSVLLTNRNIPDGGWPAS